ncbi:related to O-methyltransferase [Ramularia collo-cygni]|uniref:Related to O-methyltransferase n=1 Tax=Ramularia collo-cygni TaxID=112498 RepID=A0A2D3V6K8_9PEZI|nr:related to O-methyltransferase [Ramularia collo-cygni]CZT15953.1 related to O-methyltransferase [Ramularia collo-cygni]
MDDEDPRAIVQTAYDSISNWYLDWAKSLKSPRERYVEILLKESITPSPSVLELGCGPGVPILRMLLDRGASVIGNDISSQQLRLAKSSCPEAELVAGDMSLLSFPSKTYDGVVYFYTIFHLPRAEQKNLLEKIYAWLKPGGMFLCNFAAVDEDAIHGEFLGHGMFWSSFSADANQSMVKEVGFEMVVAEVSGAAGDEDFDAGVEFLWVVARKRLMGSEYCATSNSA